MTSYALPQRPQTQTRQTKVSNKITNCTEPSRACRARLIAVAAPHSGDFLHAIPCTSVGTRTRLDDTSLRIVVSLRLGATICAPHTCVLWPAGRLHTSDTTDRLRSATILLDTEIRFFRLD